MTPHPDYKYARIRDGYQTLMGEITKRYGIIDLFLYKKTISVPAITAAEVLAINFRKIAELIVFANLIGHEEEYSSLHAKYADEWRLSQIIERIKKINPNYYPRAVSFEEDNDPGGNPIYRIHDIPADEWLSEGNLVEMHSLCSKLIHATNPYQEAIDLNYYDEQFKEWAKKLLPLIKNHNTYLADMKYQVSSIIDLDNGIIDVGVLEATNIDS